MGSESITFHFEGALADEHRLNFYESARFQYAAARLLVKLSQFRANGRFSKKISRKSNFDINLLSPSEGSFNLNIEDATEEPPKQNFVDLSLGDLISFVTERVIEKLDEDTLRRFERGTRTDKRNPDADLSLNALVESVLSGNTNLQSISPLRRDLARRRIAEIARDENITEGKTSFLKIDFARSQSLTAMAAPLFREMATTLRRSAETLEVTSSVDGKFSNVLFLNKQMALEIETASVDPGITAILCDVIQFNKDNGWGKLKIEEGSITTSFSIPYDVLPLIRDELIEKMKADQVYLQTYFVRDRAGQPIRLIVVGILPTPKV